MNRWTSFICQISTQWTVPRGIPKSLLALLRLPPDDMKSSALLISSFVHLLYFGIFFNLSNTVSHKNENSQRILYRLYYIDSVFELPWIPIFDKAWIPNKTLPYKGSPRRAPLSYYWYIVILSRQLYWRLS